MTLKEKKKNHKWKNAHTFHPLNSFSRFFCKYALLLCFTLASFLGRGVFIMIFHCVVSIFTLLFTKPTPIKTIKLDHVPEKRSSYSINWACHTKDSWGFSSLPYFHFSPSRDKELHSSTYGLRNTFIFGFTSPNQSAANVMFSLRIFIVHSLTEHNTGQTELWDDLKIGTVHIWELQFVEHWWSAALHQCSTNWSSQMCALWSPRNSL